ncbi:MAG: zinc-dependent metalloprotease [Planctomycetota bacterium]
MIPTPSFLRSGAALLGLCAAAGAQTPTTTFPLLESDTRTALDGHAVHVPDMEGIARLDAFEDIRMTGMTGPGGEEVVLDLVRIDVERRKFGVQVNGEAVADPFAGLELSVWKGSIDGDPFSDVMVSFSHHGCQGWVRNRDGLMHLLPVANEDGSWFGAGAVLTLESDLNERGLRVNGNCAATAPPVPPIPSQLDPAPEGQLRAIESISLRECPIAMETDYQLYENWNDLSAATAYVTTVLSFISDRYELQASTVLTFPYLQFYTTPSDPWTTPDTGGSTIDLLNEFRDAWLGNIPAGATLAHIMSGANLGGGVAYLDVLCVPDFAFGVSANIQDFGTASFPVVQGPSNWDFTVVAHELGHNFSSPHTHDFCPPLDECAPDGFYGACQTQQTCTSSGTIMSYCHLCSGGSSNITTFFHPEVSALMTTASATCNDALFEVLVDAPDFVSDTQTTPVTLTTLSGSVTGATLFYQTASAGSPSSVAMTGGGSTLTADLPAIVCGEAIDFWIEFDVATFGTFNAPAEGASMPYVATGGTLAVAFADDFETDQGWTASNAGASSGDWQRGTPVDDGGWDYDPASDADGSGQAFLTQNENGNTDVDGGSVTLTSPNFDLSDIAGSVSYSYFLRLTNSDGTDALVIEANDGTGGWIEVNRHDLDGGLAWRDATIPAADFVSAGLTLGPNMRVRFTANDGDPQSIVEAGVDGFAVGAIDCGGLGSRYCSPAVPNLTGLPATIRAEGSEVATDNDVTLIAEQLPPSQFGLFVTSLVQDQTPLGGGNLCLGGQIGRYSLPAQIQQADAAGTFSLALDLNQTPQGPGLIAIGAGESWNFQAWFRDGGFGANLTDGIEIDFD